MGEAAALISAFTWSCTSICLTSPPRERHPSSSAPSGYGQPRPCAHPDHFGRDRRGACGVTRGSHRDDRERPVGLRRRRYALHQGVETGRHSATFPHHPGPLSSLTVLGGIVLLGEPFSIGLPVGGALTGFGIFPIVIRGRQGPPAPGRRASAEGGGPLHPGIWTDGAGRRRPGCGDDVVGRGTGRPRRSRRARCVLRLGRSALLAFAGVTQPTGTQVPFANRRHIGIIASPGSWGTAFGASCTCMRSRRSGRAARSAILNSDRAGDLAVPLSVRFLKPRSLHACGSSQGRSCVSCGGRWSFREAGRADQILHPNPSPSADGEGRTILVRGFRGGLEPPHGFEP